MSRARLGRRIFTVPQPSARWWCLEAAQQPRVVRQFHEARLHATTKLREQLRHRVAVPGRKARPRERVVGWIRPVALP